MTEKREEKKSPDKGPPPSSAISTWTRPLHFCALRRITISFPPESIYVNDLAFLLIVVCDLLSLFVSFLALSSSLNFGIHICQRKTFCEQRLWSFSACKTADGAFSFDHSKTFFDIWCMLTYNFIGNTDISVWKMAFMCSVKYHFPACPMSRADCPASCWGRAE